MAFGGSMVKGRARKSWRITPPKLEWVLLTWSFKVARFMSFHTSSIVGRRKWMSMMMVIFGNFMMRWFGKIGQCSKVW